MESSLDRTGLLDVVGEAAAEHPEVAAAYVYGSMASGRSTPLSDVDVALLFAGERVDDRRRSVVAAAVGSEVARRMRDGGSPAREVEVRDLEALPLAVRGSVLTEGRLAGSADEVRRVRFEELTRRRYFDFLPVLRRDAREGLEGLRERFLDG